MKKISILLLLFAMTLNNFALAIQIPAGTLVTVAPDKLIDADEVKLGDNVYFSTVDPIKVNGNVVIKPGAKVIGQVVKRKNNGILGLPGELQVGNLKLETPKNEYIGLRGTVDDKGDGRYWANVGWIFVWPLLFVKGGDGKIAPSVPKVLYTSEDF